jgi:hypothetical protein
VDFPEPFGPINPIRSPSETVKETFWKSGLAPKAFEIPCALRIGGNGGVLPRSSSRNLMSLEVIRKVADRDG